MPFFHPCKEHKEALYLIIKTEEKLLATTTECLQFQNSFMLGAG